MIEILKRLLRTPQGALGSLIIVLTIILVVFGPVLAPHDPQAMSPLARYKGPSAEFLLGTDQCCRDILSRLLMGGQATVVMSIAATVLGTLFGTVVGTTSAFLGGRVDEAIMRTVDAVISIPRLLFALLIVNLLGSSTFNSLMAVAVVFAPGMARIT